MDDLKNGAGRSRNGALRATVAAGIRILRGKISGANAPFFLSYAVTFRCTSNCAYCRLPNPGKELSFVEWRPLLEKFRALGLVRIGFTGGEPLLHTDIGVMIDYCRRSGITTVLSTNGVLVEEKIELLHGLDYASVSIDGGRDLNDRLRGEGSFEAVTRAVDLLQETGVKVLLSCTLNSENLEEADRLIEFASKKKVATVWQPYFLNGRPPAKDDPMAPDSDRLRALAKRLIQLKLRHPSLVASSFPYLRFIRNHYPVYDTSTCPAGHFFFALSPDGNLHPCYPWAVSGSGVEVNQSNIEETVKTFKRPVCTAPCFCNGHVENRFLFRFNPLSVANVFTVNTGFIFGNALKRWALPGAQGI